MPFSPTRTDALGALTLRRPLELVVRVGRPEGDGTVIARHVAHGVPSTLASCPVAAVRVVVVAAMVALLSTTRPPAPRQTTLLVVPCRTAALGGAPAFGGTCKTNQAGLLTGCHGEGSPMVLLTDPRVAGSARVKKVIKPRATHAITPSVAATNCRGT